MALVVHLWLKLHKINIKTAFLYGDLEEEVYMDQLEGFMITKKENLVCKLKN